MANRVAIETDRRAFFTTATLAAYLQLSERYVRELLVTGEIPSYLFGRARRVDPADVDSWLQQRKERRAA